MSEPTQTDRSGEGSGDEAYCAACNQSFTIDHDFCPNDGAKLVKLTSGPDTLLDRVFDGRYQIRKQLGHGGMGSVYRGWQRSVDREVAIKVIHPKLAKERSVAKRFLREARLASRLSQPNIVNVYDFGQAEDGVLYLVMELLKGQTLGKELESQRGMPLRRIVTIATQICDALDAAHAQGIVHRDLKPGNIVLLSDPPGRDLIKILDFGLAKSLVSETTSLTQTDALLGTPLYMPPEQILGKPSDHRADLYSLGCILYQMAVGRPPFLGENVNATLAAHVQAPAPSLPASSPPALAAIVHKLMQKEPADRFASAREVQEVIAKIPLGESADVLPAPATAPPLRLAAPAIAPISQPVSSIQLEGQRRRWVLPFLGLALAGAAVAAVVMATRTGGTRPAGSDAAAGAAPAEVLVVGSDTAPIDAGEEAPVIADAGKLAPDARIKITGRPPRVSIDAGVRIDAMIEPRTIPHDAQVAPGDARPRLDYLKLDAGR